jgi:hypothetical protein
MDAESPMSSQYSPSEQDNVNRHVSRTSILAENRRAYITKSIASAESLLRRESISNLALSAPNYKDEKVPPMPGITVSLSKSSNSSPISAPQEQPISGIPSSSLDHETEKVKAPTASINDNASTSSAVTIRNSVEELDTPSVALKEDYRAFIEAISNFRKSWLNDDEEGRRVLLLGNNSVFILYLELERQEKERCANLLTLLRSEQKFVRMLKLLKNQFIIPLQQAAKRPGIYVGRSFSEKDITSVFGLVEQLLPVHEALLHDLEQR